jgi:hypothetical protein
MMRPIILSAERDTDDGPVRCEVFCNPAAIAYFKPAQNRNGTYVYFMGDVPYLRVIESPEQVARQLEQNRASLRAEERDDPRPLRPLVGGLVS